MKNWSLATVGAFALALTAAPAHAQDAAEDAMEAIAVEDIFGEMAEMFQVDPLTPEQEARMPLARELMVQVLPEGALGDVMDGFFGGTFGDLASLAELSPNDALNQAFGHYFFLELEGERAEEALDILEPGWRERREAEQAAELETVRSFMTAMEPVMRETMAELYAIYFTDAQLRDIKAFYETPTGQVFARESITMSSDPRLVAGLFRDETFLTAVSEMPDMMTETEGLTGATRAYEDLSAEERRRLATLTGQTLEDIEHALSWDESAMEWDVDEALESE